MAQMIKGVFDRQAKENARKAKPVVKEALKKEFTQSKKKLTKEQEKTMVLVDNVVDQLMPMLEVKEVLDLATTVLIKEKNASVTFMDDPNTRGGGAHFDKNSQEIVINPADSADIIADNLIYEMCNAELVATYKGIGQKFNNKAINLDGFADEVAATEYVASRKYAIMMKQAQEQGKTVCDKGLKAIAFFEQLDPHYFDNDHTQDPPEPNLLQAFKDSPHSPGSQLTTKDMYLWEKLQKQDAKSLGNAAINFHPKLPPYQPSGAIGSVEEAQAKAYKERQAAFKIRTEAIRSWIAQLINGVDPDAKPQLVLDLVAALDPICPGIQAQFQASQTIIQEAPNKARAAGYNGLGQMPNFPAY